MAVRFGTQFGLHWNCSSLRSKWDKMPTGKNATGKGDVTGKQGAADKGRNQQRIMGQFYKYKVRREDKDW